MSFYAFLYDHLSSSLFECLLILIQCFKYTNWHSLYSKEMLGSTEGKTA